MVISSHKYINMHLEYFYNSIGYYDNEVNINLELLPNCSPIEKALTSILWDAKLIIAI